MCSLKYHVHLRRGLRSDGPTETERQRILVQSFYAYKEAAWEIPSDFLTYEHYARVVRSLDWNSSPGYPYMMRSPNNRTLFGVNDAGEPAESELRYYYEIVKRRIEEKSIADPIRLFIKPEPHKEKKLVEGRYRLISSVSVVDQIIDHMLFGEMNQKMIQKWHSIPNKAGWSPVNGG